VRLRELSITFFINRARQAESTQLSGSSQKVATINQEGLLVVPLNFDFGFRENSGSPITIIIISLFTTQKQTGKGITYDR
jgi:hypothetical protein